MKIFAIDDEKAMLDALHEAIVAAEPDAEVLDFKRAKPALAAIEETGAPDVVFSDIELPGIDGISLATKIKDAAPDAKIVFVTAFPSYALDAYRVHVDGFVVKPVEAERIREELDALFPKKEPMATRLTARCFGTFEVFAHGEPLVFSRTRTKELLAFLVDRNGGACTGPQIANALWEGQVTKNAQSYLRVLTADLKSALDSAGLSDVLVREHGQWAIRPERIDCDYYRFLAGDAKAAAAFDGSYMAQYSWAEETAAHLYFMIDPNPF
jgi:two-component SAPR family response regulator